MHIPGYGKYKRGGICTIFIPKGTPISRAGETVLNRSDYEKTYAG